LIVHARFAKLLNVNDQGLTLKPESTMPLQPEHPE